VDFTSNLSWLLFADDAAKAAEKVAENGAGSSLLIPLLMIGTLFFFLILRPERNRQKQSQQMLANLKKGERVLTQSGIYGVVTNVQQDADKVTLKVDENTNTKINVTLSSIARVLSEQSESDSTNKK